MQKLRPALLLFFFSILLSAIGHAVFLYQWSRGQFMTGINDGLSQMMPFKHLLYEQYTRGELFYSFDFGLGAGTFSELSYYFSTSIVFLMTVTIVFILKMINIIQETDVLFWANAAVFISIIRLAAVLFITTRLFMYMKISKPAALLGASLYGITGMYFRHVTYWEFFADAFLWLPILLFGVEKIFREQKPGWFLAAVAVSMIDNFYFAYINFILTALYILFRLFIPLEQVQQDKKKVLMNFAVAGLIGAGISAVSFIPAVYAYLNNHRPPFQQEIPWIDVTDNILFNSRFIVLPAFFVLLLFCAFLYRNKTFRLFALLGIVGIAMHHSPLIGSVFNGFSAPQYRWEYFLSLVMGGAVAAAFDQLHKFTLRRFAIAGVFAFFCFALYAYGDEYFTISSLVSIFTFGNLLITLLLLFFYTQFRKPLFKWLLMAFLFGWTLLFANLYQVEKILEDGNISEVSKELITGPEYDDPEINEMLDYIHSKETAEIYRIEWMEGVRNNTPIVQDFQGLSAYSSILNKNLLYFYLYDLEIDMGRESVSRYATLGNRANLYSLLQGKYIIRPLGDKNIPYGFTKIYSTDNYAVHENEYVLPFARSTSTVYQEQLLAEMPMLMREQAMLTGIVLDEAQDAAPLPDSGNNSIDFDATAVGATYNDGNLEVTEETGGLDVRVKNPTEADGDLFVSFHLENKAANQGFPLQVNDYYTTRKSNQSVYKTFVDDLTIRIPAEEQVEIRLPQGSYELTGIQLSSESYEILREQASQPDLSSNLVIDGSHVSLDYSNVENDDYLKLAIPYERGWRAKVNGQQVEVLKADYGFSAISLEPGDNKISLSYQPPFFKLALLISIGSMILGLLFVFRKRKR
ncbi:YfhO family protein [Planococcus sp. CPCC 101016]|uniref:YfhO family protein n=1 Tax=Planococcus sp. CPCC 101016 TaxID=2599617 RepID=UPI0011B41809|nr:YfhO family protein [Planococcus sp. CPCC 101016]TWT06724.1 YfhO family protein [Planococcus sp. CPCC 101016]